MSDSEDKSESSTSESSSGADSETYAAASFTDFVKKGIQWFSKKPKGVFKWNIELSDKLKNAVYFGDVITIVDAPKLNGLILYLTEWNEKIQAMIKKSTERNINADRIQEMMNYFMAHQNTFVDKSGNRLPVSKYDGSNSKKYEAAVLNYTQNEHANIAVVFKKLQRIAKESGLIKEAKKNYNEGKGAPIKDASFAGGVFDKIKAGLGFGDNRITLIYEDKALELVKNFVLSGATALTLHEQLLISPLLYAILENNGLKELTKQKNETADAKGFDKLISVFRWYPNKSTYATEFATTGRDTPNNMVQVNLFGDKDYVEIAKTVDRIKQYKKGSDFLKLKQSQYSYSNARHNYQSSSDEEEIFESDEEEGVEEKTQTDSESSGDEVTSLLDRYF